MRGIGSTDEEEKGEEQKEERKKEREIKSKFVNHID